MAAMATEEMLRANPVDGVVLLGGCDKTIPALLMAAASVDLPAVVVPGGPMLTGTFRAFWPLGNTRLEKRLGLIEAPTLVLWGESDGIVTPNYGRAYAGLIPGARAAILRFRRRLDTSPF